MHLTPSSADFGAITVNFVLAPRSFDRLSDAYEYVDGFLSDATDYDTH